MSASAAHNDLIWIGVVLRTMRGVIDIDCDQSIIETAREATLGIEEIHFHDLRHEGTSRLFEKGYRFSRFNKSPCIAPGQPFSSTAT